MEIIQVAEHLPSEIWAPYLCLPETENQNDETTLPAAAATYSTAEISGEGVNVPDDFNFRCDRNAPLVEGQSDANKSRRHINAAEMGATQLPLPQGGVEQVGKAALRVAREWVDGLVPQRFTGSGSGGGPGRYTGGLLNPHGRE
jgi:hypothetical protein